MLKICLVSWESEPQYAYKLYVIHKALKTSGALYPSLWLIIWKQRRDAVETSFQMISHKQGYKHHEVSVLYVA